MVKINEAALIKAIPELIKTTGGELPIWMKKTGEIVEGINKMLEAYQNIAGKPVAPSANNIPDFSKPSSNFFEARELKKAEVAAQRKLPVAAPETIIESGEKMSEFKGVLEGLIKTIKTLQGMGYGEKKIGEVLLELPFTVDQTQAFLLKLHTSKYE